MALSPIPVTVDFTGRTPGGGERKQEDVELGRRFYVPDAMARERLERYKDAEEFLDLEKHERLYQTLTASTSMRGVEQHGGDNEHWIPLDFAGMLSRLMRQYTFGEGFRVRAVEVADGQDLAKAQNRINDISDGNSVLLLLRKVVEAAVGLGDGVVRLGVEDAQDDLGEMAPRAVMQYVHPGSYFPEFDPMDASRRTSVTLAWVIPIAGEDGKLDSADMMVLREIHTPAGEGEDSGRIEYKLHKWDGGELGDSISVNAEFPDLKDGDTGVREIPVVHFGYQVQAGSHFGVGEFKRIKRIVLAMENRLAQEDEVLDKHARPKLIVGPGVLDEDAQARLQDFDVIEVAADVFENAVKPEYLTWDMQITALQHEMEKLEEYFFMFTETSPASFGLERDGSQVESARALRFKAHRTVSKVEDLRDEYRQGIRALYRVAQLMENTARKEDSLPALPTAKVRPVFPDPIVEDQTQEVQDFATLKGAGLVSRERAVADLFDLSPDDAEAESTAILQDEVDEAAAATSIAPTTPLPGQEPEQGGIIPPAAVAAAASTAPDPTRDRREEPGLGVEGGIQSELLSGGQIASMVAVVSNVAAGTLPRESGLAILQTAFGLDTQKAADIMGSAGLEDIPDEPEETETPPDGVEPGSVA